MILRVYSIRDSKAEVFHSPFFQKTHGEAERNFIELTRDERSLIAKYPEDFDLWYLGTFDDQTGVISMLTTPEHVTKAVLVKQGDAQKFGMKIADDGTVNQVQN